jgi:hypothetical protein
LAKVVAANSSGWSGSPSALLLSIPNHDALQEVRTLLRGSVPAQTDDLVGQDGTVSGQVADLLHLIDCAVFHSIDGVCTVVLFQVVLL